MHRMRKAGMREVRKDLISLLDDVREGREVVIMDTGRPVARLVPVRSPRPFPDLKRVRASAGRLARARLSDALLADREDRV
jgi:prevent-host-death family protein